MMIRSMFAVMMLVSASTVHAQDSVRPAQEEWGNTLGRASHATTADRAGYADQAGVAQQCLSCLSDPNTNTPFTPGTPPGVPVTIDEDLIRMIVIDEIQRVRCERGGVQYPLGYRYNSEGDDIMCTVDGWQGYFERGSADRN